MSTLSKPAVFDLFAGAGGFGLGFELAGFNLSLSLEIDKWAVETLRANHRNSIILQDDIRLYNNLSEIKKYGSPDVIIGGPPCQGFSTARRKTDLNDPRNSLFMDFSRWVDYFRPNVFVMENVKGLIHRKNGANEPVIDIIKSTFFAIGYEVEIWTLNAANYGVPQSRTRVFIVGNKLNQIIGPPSATHNFSVSGSNKQETDNNLLPAITVEEALSDLPMIYAGQGEEIMPYTREAENSYQKWARHNCSLVFNHEAMKHTKRLVARFEKILEGTEVSGLPDDLKVRKRNGNGEHSNVFFQSNYRHLKPDMVSYTIPASFYSNFVHPKLPRNITSREAARIQSFPDWYIFRGKRTQISSKLLKKLGKESADHLSQYNQIGNAVPPLLAKAIGERIKRFISQKCTL